MRKYRNKKVEIDGYTFDSMAEARRYEQLRLLEYGRKIKNLTVHPRFPLIVNEVLVCTYVGDFSYFDVEKNRAMLEDVKGFKTEKYRLKKKLFEAIHPTMKITEVPTR